MGSWDEKEAKRLFQKLPFTYTNFYLHLLNTFTEKTKNYRFKKYRFTP